MRIIMTKFCPWAILFVLTVTLVQVSDCNIRTTKDVILALRKLSSGQPTNILIELAGYQLEVHEVPTQDGYFVQLIKVINPLIDSSIVKKKRPAYFVHGWLITPAEFVLFGSNGKPSNWSHLDPNQMSEEELIKFIGKDEASKALPFLMSNFGHECWLIARRPTEESTSIVKKHHSRSRGFKSPQDEEINLISDDEIDVKTDNDLESRNFWDFSFDEQAKYDLPMTIDYILEKSGHSRLILVGHSAGGLLILATLIAHPEYSEKISHAALFAPAFHLGYTKHPAKDATHLEYIYRRYVGPVPTITTALPILGLQERYCFSRGLKFGCVLNIFDDFLGPGTKQLDLLTFITKSRLFMNGVTSSHECAQIIQSVKKVTFHAFDFGKQRNLEVYGAEDSPRYDVGRIKSKRISIWQGVTDHLVTKENTDLLREDNWKVPFEYYEIGNKSEGILFNHLAFVAHKNIVPLLNIPALKRMIRKS